MDEDEATPSLGYEQAPPAVIDTRNLSIQILEDSHAQPVPAGLPLFRLRMRRFLSQFVLIKVSHLPFHVTSSPLALTAYARSCVRSAAVAVHDPAVLRVLL
jgi:hypothetical protein